MESVVSENSTMPEKSMKGQKFIQTFIWDNILSTKLSETRREPGTDLIVLGREVEFQPMMAVTIITVS